MHARKWSWIGVVVFCSLKTAQGAWPQFGGTPDKAAASMTLAPRLLPAAERRQSAARGVKPASGVVVADGCVYAYAAGAPTGLMYCLDAVTLTTRWSAPVAVADYGYGSWATPAAVASSVVYAADAFLGCWNADGSARWTVTLPDQTVNSSPVIVGERVLVGMFSYMNTRAALAAYAVATGSQLWHSVVMTGTVFSIFSSCTPAIDVAAGKGYACCNDLVWQFDLASGATGWVTRIAGKALNNVTLVSNRVCVVNYDAFAATAPDTNLFVLGAGDGALQWAGVCGMSDVAPAAHAGVVVHSCGDSAITPAVTAFDLVSGGQLWQQSNVGHYALLPAISKGAVYAAAGVYSGWDFVAYTNLSVLDLRNGAVLSRINSLQGGGSPALHDDVLYTANNGVVYAYAWQPDVMAATRLTGRVRLQDIGKDMLKLRATTVCAWPAWFTNEITLRIGDAILLERVQGTAIDLHKTCKASWKFVSADKSVQATMRWKQARQQLVLTAQMKQHSLRGALPYGTNDGVVAATVSSVLCAGDYAAYLRANDEVTFKTKRANVRFKKGQW
jgi:outer membrane protein assembly factor BamB